MSEMQGKPGGELVVYRAEDGRSHIRVLLQDETVWLTQRFMLDLYQVGVNTIKPTSVRGNWFFHLVTTCKIKQSCRFQDVIDLNRCVGLEKILLQESWRYLQKRLN